MTNHDIGVVLIVLGYCYLIFWMFWEVFNTPTAKTRRSRKG